MKKKYVVILCMLLIAPLAGCHINDPYDDETDDYYWEDDSSVDPPQDYTPPAPPACVIYAECDALNYSSQEETASVKVTIQNTSPDEAARNVSCVVKMKNGSTVMVQASLNFYEVAANGTGTQWASCTTMKPQKWYDNFECEVTWQDDMGNNYVTTKAFPMYL